MAGRLSESEVAVLKLEIGNYNTRCDRTCDERVDVNHDCPGVQKTFAVKVPSSKICYKYSQLVILAQREWSQRATCRQASDCRPLMPNALKRPAAEVTTAALLLGLVVGARR
jgi:hypothetical protein